MRNPDPILASIDYFDAQMEELSNIIEIIPGLNVVLTSMTTPSPACTFIGDPNYIHINCLLRGRFEAKACNTDIYLEEGETNIGFSKSDTFCVPELQPFICLAVLIQPDLLQNIAGDELPRECYASNLSFFVKGVGKDKRALSAALQIVSLIQDFPKNRVLLHSAVLNFIHWNIVACGESLNEYTVRGQERKQLEAAKQYLIKDLTEAPTIATIADRVNLNQCRLKKGFKCLYGRSIYSYFQFERMSKALELLKELNVTETAVTLGYSNISHFSAAFRKEFGVQPKEVKKGIQFSVLEAPVHLDSFERLSH